MPNFLQKSLEKNPKIVKISRLFAALFQRFFVFFAFFNLGNFVILSASGQAPSNVVVSNYSAPSFFGIAKENSAENFTPEIFQNLQHTANSPAFDQLPYQMEQNYSGVFGLNQKEIRKFAKIGDNYSENAVKNSQNTKNPGNQFSSHNFNLYNQEQEFNEKRNKLSLPEFRDIDGRLTPRYTEQKLSIYKPKTPTPSRFFSADLSMPENFASTNNLAKKTGAFYRAYGQVIFIQGNVTDSFGVPIHNAIVEIWQTNSAGKYHSLLEPYSEFIDPYFNMSGRAITDNLGNYYFITIMPGSSVGRAPHINFNILHPRFGKLETEMYFEKHPYNANDSQFLSYSEAEQKMLTAAASNTDILNPRSIKIFTFNIVMRGIHQYKKF